MTEFLLEHALTSFLHALAVVFDFPTTNRDSITQRAAHRTEISRGTWIMRPNNRRAQKGQCHALDGYGE
jgi:hypothetical protein